jgi:hypothetical protein
MSMTNSLENSILLLLFNATAIADVAENDASSPATAVHAALATADPGEAAVMNTSEITYTSYARVSVNRNSGGWTVTNNSVSPGAEISFPAGTGGAGTATHFQWGLGSSGATVAWFNGTVTPNIVTGSGVTPILTTASAVTLD